ncbi:Aldo/keto reductase [Phellopilus nigrolimitatus]|nr:Aldo/keto reductase [Phellopilus nigrolimitatus]
MNKIPTRQLGRNGPMVSAIGFGAMGIGAWYGKTDEDAAFKALTYAADRGMTFWDTADVYGTSELMIGKWFADTGRRGEIFLAIKFGAYDPEEPPSIHSISKPSYIKSALARSLERLGTSYIDLYYQHLVDPNVPIEIVLETLRAPLEEGKIRWIGLSECGAEKLTRARAVPRVGEKVVACQMEFSSFEIEVEKDEFAKAACEEGVAVVAHSPLGKGMISGQYRSRAAFEEGDLRLLLPRFSEENFEKNLELVDKIKLVADKYGATPTQIALAWILAEHGNFIPIPGCRSAARVEENAHAAELVLASDDVRAIRMLTENADIRGERLPKEFMHFLDTMPLKDWKGE